jgi:hypothetical protein
VREDYRLFEKIPKGYDIFTTDEGITRVFIPSKLADNKYLGEDYIRSLRAACAGNDELLQAWLLGDWSIIDGAFFETWSGQHVIEPFAIPQREAAQCRMVGCRWLRPQRAALTNRATRFRWKF